MIQNQKSRANTSNLTKCIAVGTLSSMCSTILGVCIAAWLLVSEKFDENAINYITLLVLLFSSAAGVYISTLLTQEKHIIVGMSVGLLFLLTLLGITALFFKGSYSGVGENALVITAGAISVVLLRKNNRTNRKKIRRR